MQRQRLRAFVQLLISPATTGLSFAVKSNVSFQLLCPGIFHRYVVCANARMLLSAPHYPITPCPRPACTEPYLGFALDNLLLAIIVIILPSWLIFIIVLAVAAQNRRSGPGVGVGNQLDRL